MAISLKIDEQVKYAMEEVKRFPKGYVFEITDIVSVSRCVGAANWLSFKAKLQTMLLRECNPIGYGKYKKR